MPRPVLAGFVGRCGFTCTDTSGGSLLTRLIFVLKSRVGNWQGLRLCVHVLVELALTYITEVRGEVLFEELIEN